jgi:hypothetical protein
MLSDEGVAILCRRGYLKPDRTGTIVGLKGDCYVVPPGQWEYAAPETNAATPLKILCPLRQPKSQSLCGAVDEVLVTIAP